MNQNCTRNVLQKSVLWIRNFCLELKFLIWIQQKVKEHINKTVNSGLFVLLDSSIEQRMANTVIVRILLFDLINIGLIWIRNFCLDLDPELGKFKAGSGSGINHSGSPTLIEMYSKCIRTVYMKKERHWRSNHLPIRL